MKHYERIKPISYLKANAAEIIRELHEVGEPYIITQNGEAKAVMQDIKSYEAMQETMALLKLLSLSLKQAEEGKVHTVKQAVKLVRKRSKENETL